MIKPAIPKNEAERIKALEEYEILDTLPEQDFDELTKIAAEICQTPISLVSLVDPNRQWFKSHHGLDATETPREYAFCAHAINNPEELLIVTDASKDERFHDNPLSVDDPNVIFYAGAPLITPEGHPLGTLCVIDHEPRSLNTNQEQALKALSNQVVAQLELRKKIRLLEKQNKELDDLNKDISNFAYIVSHDLKTPLRGIISLSEWLLEDYLDDLDKEGKDYLDLIKKKALHLNELIIGVLNFTKAGKITEKDKETINCQTVVKDVIAFVSPPPEIAFQYKNLDKVILVFKLGLKQVLQNIIGNAIKYNDKYKGEITISLKEEEKHYHFSIEDNGPGISKENRERIFGLFQTLGEKDRFQKKGTGVGLAIVKKVIEKMGGEIRIEAAKNHSNGSRFEFTIKK